MRGERPGALNQALMELGATICTKRSPRCGECPIARACIARKSDRTGELPFPRAKKAPRAVSMVAVIARPPSDARVWLVRSEGTLFGGLFGVPMIEGADRRAARRALAQHGFVGTIGALRGHVEHVLTHRRLELRVYDALTERAREHETRRLAAIEGPIDVGIATLTRKVLRLASGARR